MFSAKRELYKILSIPIERGRGLFGHCYESTPYHCHITWYGRVIELYKIHCIPVEKENRTDGIRSAWDLYGQK